MSHIINDVITSHFVVALEELGILRYIGARKEFTISEIAATFQINSELFYNVCEYLGEEQILEKIGEKTFHLPEGSHEYLKFLANIILFNKDMLKSIAKLMDGTFLYARDAATRWEYLKNVEMLISGALPPLAARLAELKPKVVLDINCGKGLAVALRTIMTAIPHVRGIGVDIDPVTVAETNALIATLPFRNMLTVFQADIENPRLFPEEAKEADVLIDAGVFHELRRNSDEEWIITLLKRYREQYPKATLFVVEPEEPSWDVVHRTEKEGAAKLYPLYKIVHTMAEQGYPASKEEWIDAIARAGWEISHIYPLPSKLFAYECISK